MFCTEGIKHCSEKNIEDFSKSDFSKERLKAAHAPNMIFWNFFFFSPKRLFILWPPLLLESFQLVQSYLLE
jgi:hypothetical protein